MILTNFGARRAIWVALIGAMALSCSTQAQNSPAGRGGRLMPPKFVTCDRNQLTSWTGRVIAYRRTEHGTWLEIGTDEHTVESTSIGHDGKAQAAKHYLMWGRPFTEADWGRIEKSPGVLIDGMRATAWICRDGKTPPVVDWQPEPD